MKTSVSRLFFDWVDPYTGEYPKAYSIRVEDPKSKRHEDLKSHYAIKLLSEYGDKAINFPKALTEEVYDDCCLAYLTRLATMGETKEVFSIKRDYVDGVELQKIVNAMKVRCFARIDVYLERTIGSHYKSCECDLRSSLNLFANLYKEEEDTILSLTNQDELVRMTLILLNLRRDIWRASPKAVQDRSKRPLDGLFKTA